MTDLWAMAESDGMFVLSGQPAAETWSGQLWFSEDGFHWERATMPAEPHIARIHAVAATSTGFAALALDFGGDDTLTHALVSADGRAWQPTGSYPGMGTNLAEIDGRLLAFGDVDRLSDPWYSDDGAVTWEKLDTDSGRAVANGLLTLHQADGYLWAVRSDNPVEDASIRTPVELWRTSDGLDWELLGELPDSISVSSAAIATGPNGWVITARRATFTGPGEQQNSWFAWRSADGMTWQPASNVPRYVNQIVGFEHGFVAIGRDPGPCCVLEASNVRQHVWVSADGSAWQQFPEKGWHGREIDFITTVGESIRAIGMDWLLAPGPADEAWGVGWEIERDELLP